MVAPGVATVIDATVDPRYWVIHGRSYDLSTFVDSHPGGAYIIQLGQGRDCTELFETVHALGGLSKARKILEKFEVSHVPKQDNTDYFIWDDNGFYSVLRERVAERFKGRNTKATWFLWAKLVLMFSAYLFCWYQAVMTGNILWAAGTGIFTEMIGFCMMHGSSHNAFSYKPSVNYAGLLWSSWTLWSHWLWLQHHVYGHHSYTGVYGKDPDIHNLALIVRKHFDSEQRPTTRFQHLYTWPLLIVLPGQHMGQIILYLLLPLLTNQIFITPVIRSKASIFFHVCVMFMLSLMFHVGVPLLYQSVWTVAALWVTNMVFMGLSYFFNVLPNHDTESTLQNHPETGKRIDWGEQQVRCTGNHSISSSWVDYIVTQLWGGMNYQIEHHLFPTLNHSHYHEVSLIVQDTCKEYGIPYVAHDNWFQSAASFSKLLRVMAKIPGAEQYTKLLSK